MAKINPYQENAVLAATPVELVVMVYDACINSLNRAEQAFSVEGPERIEQIGNHLLRAQNAITELSMSLDMEKGADIADDLSRLYDFMTNHLIDANVNKNLQGVLDVRQMMMDLRDTWNQVAQQVGGQHTSESMRAGRISIGG